MVLPADNLAVVNILVFSSSQLEKKIFIYREYPLRDIITLFKKII
jgi:hypothetical protein